MTTRQRALAKVATKPPRPVAVIELEIGVLNALLLNPNRLADARRVCLSQRRKMAQAELVAARAAQTVTQP